MGKGIELSPRELLYIASLTDAVEFMGIPDAFYGLDETEIRQEIVNLQRSLESKGLAEGDFDGNFAVNESVMALVEVCANCNTYILMEKPSSSESNVGDLYYFKGKKIVQLKHMGECYCLSEVSECDELLKQLTGELQLSDQTLSESAIQISSEILEKVKEAGADISSLTQHGFSQEMAEAAVEGLSGNAKFYSLIITSFNNDEENIIDLMFIDTKHGVLRLIRSDDIESDAIELAPTSAAEIVSLINDNVSVLFNDAVSADFE